MLELQNKCKRIINSFSLALNGTVEKSQPIKEQCVHYFYDDAKIPIHILSPAIQEEEEE